MSNQASKKGNQNKGEKKVQMDSEVTRIVLIFLLFLVIVVLLVAAFMSLGHGENTNPQGNVIQIQVPTEGEGTVAATTADPNHGNTETEKIPDEVLDPSLVTTESITYTNPPETMPVDIMSGETMPGAESAAFGGTTVPGAVVPPVSYTTTGARTGNPTPVYIATTDPYAGIATLAPPLTTAGSAGSITTVTTTIADGDTPSDGTVTSTNYTVPLSGSATIYSAPNGSSNGTIGSNGTFTIVQEMVDSSGVKWGKLKSGAGWVRLS